MAAKANASHASGQSPVVHLLSTTIASASCPSNGLALSRGAYSSLDRVEIALPTAPVAVRRRVASSFEASKAPAAPLRRQRQYIAPQVSNLMRVREGLRRQSHRAQHWTNGEPDETSVRERLARSNDQEHTERRVDPKNHLQVC
jgi:hypothetical protein